jgi:uncharacterized delta-60 repeat protein
LQVERLETRTLLSAGALDPTFGNGGLVTTPILGSLDSIAQAMAVQPDGKVVVAGTSNGSVVTRYNTDGTLDATFGTGGKAPDPVASASSVAIQSDHKIVIAGSGQLARMNPDGTLDTSFGTNGVTGVSSPISSPYGLIVLSFADTLQADGKFITASILSHGIHPGDPTPTPYLALERFNTDGSPDTGFGTGGIIVDQSSPFTNVSGIAVQPDRKIVLAEEGNVLERFNPDGSLDTSFGTGGEVTSTNGGQVAIQSNGRLVVADQIGNEFAAQGYTANGSLDQTFASAGQFTMQIGSATIPATQPVTLALQADDKIVLTGPVLIAGQQEFGLLRLTANGSLDPTFNGSGEQATPLGPNCTPVGVAVLTSGKIQVAGTVTSDSGHDFGLARYNTDGSLDPTFGSGGTTTTDFVGPLNSTIQSVLVVSGGNILAVGTASNGPSSSLALARYDAQGNLDTSFGTAGVLFTRFSGEQDSAGQAVQQPDGKILVAGTFTSSAASGVFLARFNPDGSLDSGFGTGGRVGVIVAPPTNGVISTTGAAAVVLQADNQILVVGTVAPSFTPDTKVARYNPDGTPDQSFQVFDPGPSGSQIVAVQADGKILLNTGITLERLNPNGTLDTSFGMQGMAPLGFPQNATTLLPDGRILSVGSTAGVAGQIIVSRYLADGTPDPSFGLGGQVKYAHDLITTSGSVLLLQANGLLVLGGRSTAVLSQSSLVAFNPDGSLDSNFGTGGQVGIAFPGANFQLSALALQPDGNLLVGGSAFTFTNGGESPSFFALARYTGDSTMPLPQPSDNALFVAGLYHELLNRPADAGGLANLQQPLDTIRGQALGPVAMIYVTSGENRGNAIRLDYHNYLGRDASPAEVNGWLAALSQGFTLEQALALIVGSNEYYQRVGGTNTAWLDHVYGDLLARPRDPGSQAFLDALNHGAPRSSIVAAIEVSQEFETRLVNNMYVALLNRPAGPNEASLWFGLLSAAPSPGAPSPVEQFQIAILASGEYFQKQGNSAQGWVDSLYRTLLGRQPDLGGYDGTLAAVLNGYAAARQSVAAVLTSSSEYYADLVQGYYMKFLQRAASLNELAGWVQLLQNGGTDETVIAALVTSGEYAQRFGFPSLTNQQFLAEVFPDILGRSFSPTDGSYLTALDGGTSRVQVAGAILTSEEYRQQLIQSMYAAYLGRQASADDLNFWLVPLAQGARDEVVRDAILASTESFLQPHIYP